MSFQVNPKDLDKESFWVKIREEELASEDMFTELKQNFSSKAVCKCMLTNGVTAKSFCIH